MKENTVVYCFIQENKLRSGCRSDAIQMGTCPSGYWIDYQHFARVLINNHSLLIVFFIINGLYITSIKADNPLKLRFFNYIPHLCIIDAISFLLDRIVVKVFQFSRFWSCILSIKTLPKKTPHSFQMNYMFSHKTTQ